MTYAKNWWYTSRVLLSYKEGKMRKKVAKNKHEAIAYIHLVGNQPLTPYNILAD
jgi:hypothetical protein